MQNRLTAAALCLALAALGQAGCASTPIPFRSPFAPRPVVPNPLIVPSNDYEMVWRQTVAVVDEYFEIAQENRLAGRIVTQPKIGATLLEPWLGDSVGFQERLESSLQTIHRFAIVTIKPAPGGGYAVEVQVRKELEDLAKPERQAGGRAVFINDFPVNRTREVVGPVPLPLGWIPRGRDPKLERVILERLQRNLFLR